MAAAGAGAPSSFFVQPRVATTTSTDDRDGSFAERLAEGEYGGTVDNSSLAVTDPPFDAASLGSSLPRPRGRRRSTSSRRASSATAPFLPHHAASRSAAPPFAPPKLTHARVLCRGLRRSSKIL